MDTSSKENDFTPTYYDLLVSCPICFEKEGKIETEPTNWVHDTDNGSLQIGDNAMIFCTYCNEKSKITQTKWDCPKHSKELDKYIITFNIKNLDDNLGKINSIACLGQIIRQIPDSVEWMKRSVSNLD